jgi:hypothetical protein
MDVAAGDSNRVLVDWDECEMVKFNTKQERCQVIVIVAF